MNENIINNSYFNKFKNFIKSNLKNIVIFLSLIFMIFIIIQIYFFYNSSKIKNNSIEFFELQNLENLNEINQPYIELSNEDNFYGILSKLELIESNYNEKNINNLLALYQEILDSNKLNNIYKSAIASKASYQFINLNLNDINNDYLDIINDFISNIDDELLTYQGVKLELNYLAKILETQINNIDYSSSNEVIQIYQNIMNSETASQNLQDRINKIHEYFFYN